MARARIHVKRSPIHGRGAFASAAFGRGEYISSARGTSTEREGRHALWVPDGDGHYRGMKVQNELRYLNHSPRPNAGFWGTELYALRAIEPGEEITLDYAGP